MKPINAMTQGELAAYVQTRLREKGIQLVLSGGATVSIYSGNRYISRDLDLVNLNLAKRSIIGRPWRSSASAKLAATMRIQIQTSSLNSRPDHSR